MKLVLKDLGKTLNNRRQIWYCASCNIFNISAPDLTIFTMVWLSCTSGVSFVHTEVTQSSSLAGCYT